MADIMGPEPVAPDADYAVRLEVPPAVHAYADQILFDAWKLLDDTINLLDQVRRLSSTCSVLSWAEDLDDEEDQSRWDDFLRISGCNDVSALLDLVAGRLMHEKPICCPPVEPVSATEAYLRARAIGEEWMGPERWYARRPAG